MSTKLERDYARVAAEHTDHIDANNAPAANESFNELTRLRTQIRQQPDAGQASLERLIEHEDKSVRVHAATDLLITHPALAIPVLEEISKGKLSAARIMASAALYATQRGAFKETLAKMKRGDAA